MEYQHDKELEKKYKKWAILLSIVVPLLVIALFTVKRIPGVDLAFMPENIARLLPHVYATLNFLTAIFLVIAVMKIKKKQVAQHAKFINFAVYCSLFFLVGYILYHLNVEEQKFGDLDHDNIVSPEEKLKAGWVMFVYYFLLLTHILLSCVVIPVVLFTYLKGWARNVVSHRKLAKFAFPIWLYVAVTGVICYLMILPYYK